RGQTRSHIEDRIAGENSRDFHAEISADLPAHDGQKADRAPSNNLPDRNDNEYADYLPDSKDRIFLRLPRCPTGRQRPFLATTNSIVAILSSNPITSPVSIDNELQFPASE